MNLLENTTNDTLQEIGRIQLFIVIHYGIEIFIEGGNVIWIAESTVVLYVYGCFVNC